MTAWWRWRRELKRLRREKADAYDRWMRAQYAYRDAAVVFRDQPGAWSEVGPCGKALDEQTDRMNEYLILRDVVERMQQVGP